MTKRSQHFPRQLFLRFVGSQILLAVLLFFIIAIGIRIYFEHFFLYLAVVLPVVISVFTVWVGFKLVLPLGRILTKTEAILDLGSAQTNNAAEPSLAFELEAINKVEPGEWSDLESALNRIQTDIERKNTFISREREEIEAIISAISDPVLAIDKQSNLLFYNSQFLVLFGEKDIQRRKPRLSEIFRTPDILEAFQATIQDGQARTINTMHQAHNEAPTAYYSLSIAPLHQRADQDMYGAVGVFHDVTELKRAEQIRIDFVANVSHELRTPLTSIKGYTQTLKEDSALKSATPEAPKYLDIIERNVDRLIHLVTDLLNLSSLESGTALEKVNINLPDLTERVLAQLEPKRAEKEQSISPTFRTQYLEADLRRVEQVLFNLLENAIKYAPKGKKIQIIWESSPTEILLHVTDDGPGIAPEHHARLFERFYRVDQSRTRDMGGTGLGLAIVKHIMQRHGGTVRVQGGLGRGTEFICSFPKQSH